MRIRVDGFARKARLGTSVQLLLVTSQISAPGLKLDVRRPCGSHVPPRSFGNRELQLRARRRESTSRQVGLATSGPLLALSKGPASAAEVSSWKFLGPCRARVALAERSTAIAQDQKGKQNLVRIVEGHLGP